MMELTERQSKILIWIVKDYINLARPISSEFLERKYKIGISSPMIRIELQRLTEKGFLEKPHASAGRIPTDKGYRFFVNKVIKRKKKFKAENFWVKKEIDDVIKFLQILTKDLAEKTKTFVLSYLKENEILFKEGLDVFKEPEFKDKEIFSDFLEFVEDFEKNFCEFKINSEIKVFIGKENPFKRGEKFSAIFSKCCLPKKKEGFFALVGPKRMDYYKNIILLESLRNFLEKINV